MRASESLAGLHRDWTRLGEADPLWAVCVDPARRGGRWEIPDFLASGQAEIAGALALLDRLGLCRSRETALDFGCGAGRLTGALADRFASVTGVDISAPMLDRARALHGANGRCRFVLNDTPALGAFPGAAFDLVYSSLVLQHMPPGLAEGYLAEFIRVLRPGGAIVILVPARYRRTLRGLVYAWAPGRLTGLIQRRVFGYPAPMQMHVLPAARLQRVAGGHGARLAASVPRPGYSRHWQMVQHVIVKDTAPG